MMIMGGKGRGHLTGDDFRKILDEYYDDIPDVPPRGPEEHRDLARALGIKYSAGQEFRVLSVNRDPYYQGSETHWRDANWFADLWREFGYTRASNVHLRRIHYRMVHSDETFNRPDGRPYENTINCSKQLEDASRSARALGLADAEAFIDRRNRDAAEYLPPRVKSCRRSSLSGMRGLDSTCQ
jgi:hypothetical protein